MKTFDCAVLTVALAAATFIGCDTPSEEFGVETESDSDSPGSTGPADDMVVVQEEESRLMSEVLPEVSPELFEVITRWVAESAQNESGSTLRDFVEEAEPRFLYEVEELTAALGSKRFRGSCTCNILAAVDASPAGLVSETAENWSAQANGAAHSAEQYRSSNKHSSTVVSSKSNHTRVSMQMVCLDGQGQYCNASCSGKMYVYADYASKLYGWGSTSGIPSKAAHAAVADGAKLTYEAPYLSPLVLFDKVGSVSHHANKTAFNQDEVINVVRGALSIITAVKTSGAAGVDSDLVTKFITSLSKLITRSGNDGSTENEMYVAYDSRSVPPFNLTFSPLAAQVHTVKLTTQANTKNRGYGWKNADRTRYASGYLLAVAVDYFQCVNGTPPQRGGVWRYASTGYAPYNAASLQSMTQAFFDALGIQVDAQQASGKTW